ncbi:rhamnulokinase [Pleomorphomonas sp. NRK KF1]|uniref:rhamnulokinase n=1 Tax=Pleomorphomonas sp. NRK KF1 TaxID=2943000 RepID=UPI002044A735|nr:rhamnulokinase [Pleomorphomonas sp. NRK KF1]MCM5552197.1 rhamnulokinase [Pleomorphomonas sp. NRK KF1]
MLGEKQRVDVAAVDVGAGSGRVMLASFDGDRIELTEAHRFETPLGVDLATGYDCWDSEAIVREIRAGIDRADEMAPIESVGCDTWGVDYVLLDEDLRQVGVSVAYRDDRTAGMIDEVTAIMPAAEIYRRTGIHFQPYNTLYQLRATAKEHPEWLAAARHLLFTPDYLHFRLSGVVSNEFSISTTSQLLSLATRDWDLDLLDLAGVRPGLMKKPVEPGTILGPMTGREGRRPVLVIAPGGHDTASAVAAAPIGGDDEIFLSSGTWSLMGLESSVPYVGERALDFNIGNEGGVCSRYRVLKNLMGLWLIQRVRKEFGEPAFGDLVAAAAAAPAWTTLVNPDDPRFLNPASMTATIRALAAEHGEPVPEGLGAVARTVFDSLALDYARVKDELETLTGRPMTHIRIIGGGSKNALLNQLTADACGIPVSAGPVETSALGNAALQMMGLGVIGSLDEARSIVRRSFGVTEIAPAAVVPHGVRDRFRLMVQATPAAH